MAEIVFDKDYPDMIRQETEALLDNAAWLFPLWVQRVYVNFDPNDTESTNYIRVDKDYRFARLTVCSGLLDSEPERRQESIYHEILHCFTAPMSEFAQEIIDICCPEQESPKTHKLLSNELRRKCESATQDFAFVINNKFNER